MGAIRAEAEVIRHRHHRTRAIATCKSCAYYGLNNRTNDVTQLLQGQVNNGSLVMQVNNKNLGGDPAPGADKVLTVIYRVNGREQTATVKEGNTLRIP